MNSADLNKQAMNLQSSKEHEYVKPFLCPECNTKNTGNTYAKYIPLSEGGPEVRMVCFRCYGNTYNPNNFIRTSRPCPGCSTRKCNFVETIYKNGIRIDRYRCVECTLIRYFHVEKNSTFGYNIFTEVTFDGE